MNKFVLSLGLVALLAGCDKPAENKMTPPQEPAKQSAPVATTAPAATEAATENKAQTNTSVQSPTEQDTQVAESKPTEPVQPAAPAKPGDALVIDATSEQTMTASLDKMIAQLSDSEKEAFAESFLVYAMSKVDMSVDEETNQKNMLAALNGKSVKDIMTEADKIKADAEKTEQK